MKKLSLIAIAFVLAVTGIAIAQQPRKADAGKQMIPACMKLGSAITPNRISIRGYTVNQTIQHEGKTYRCSAIYDQWMTKTSRAAWVEVP